MGSGRLTVVGARLLVAWLPAGQQPLGKRPARLGITPRATAAYLQRGSVGPNNYACGRKDLDKQIVYQ